MQVKILRLLSCFALIFVCAFPALAQTRVISGNVVDSATAKPLEGVTIRATGTSLGTTTDANGSFRLQVTAAVSQLAFSYLNYTRQIVALTSSNSLTVKLAAADKVLKEVEIVNVGYGTLNRREVSSAISHVSSKDLLSVASNSPLMSLQGKVAGLTISNTASGDPNSTPSVQLRGVSSRNAGLGPLYVINNVPGGNIDNINQNDIESIDVLKGGAASAIYGTRGSNGVIIITTKKGTSQSGLFYDGYTSFDYITNKLEVLSKDDFVKNRVGSKQGQDYGGNTDWLKSVSNSPSFGQKHTLQFSGGSGKTNFLASADYRNASGIDLRANKKEYGARVNVNHTSADDIFSVSLNIAPRYAHTNTADYSGFNNALTLNPTLPVYNSTGQYNFINTGFFSNNPVENARLIQAQQEIKELDMNGTFKVNILKNLNTAVTVSEVSSSFKNLNFSPSTLSTILHSNPVNKTNYASQEQVENDVKNIEWTNNYFASFGKHDIKLLAGYSYALYDYQQFKASNYDFPFDSFLWNNLGSGTYNGGDKGNGQGAVGSTRSGSTLISFFGRASYTYDNKYILTASLRHEGSSKFGPNNKWGDFPAASAAWRISDEGFLKDKVSWLNELKLRADYGITGNQDFSSYQSLLLYGGYGYFPFDGTSYQVYGPSQNVNPNLRWEKAVNFNAGIDFDLFNSRISGSLNYYIRTNKDLLGSYNVPVPPNLQSQTYANVGTLKNSGFEIQLNASVVKSQEFKYDVSFTAALNNNRFVSFSNDIYKGAPFLDIVGLPAPGSPGNIQRIQEGERIGGFYTFKSAGVDNKGALLVYKKDGSIVPANNANNDDKQFVGNGLPKWTASLGNTFRYQNWDLGIFLRGNFGYQIFNMPAFYIGTPAAQADANVLKSAYDSNSKYAKLTSPSTASIASDYFLESGSFVKIDNISLGYSHPVSSKYIHRFRIYATGRNLHTFTKYTGGDPDLVSVNGLRPGINTNSDGNGTLNYYPSTLQLLLGAQVTF